MKKTKNYLVKLMAFMLVFVSLFNPIGAEDNTTIEITGVTPGNEFEVFKIVDIEYDEETTNAVYYYWLYDANGEKLVDRDHFQTAGEDGAIRLRAINIWQEIKTNEEEVTVYPTLTADKEGVISFTGEPGGYIFIPVKTMDVYNPMVGFIQYKENEDGNGYELDADQIVAKKNTITIDKELNEDPVVGEDQIINFKISFPVPDYDVDATNKKLQVSDYMDIGMAFDSESIRVFGDDTELNLGKDYKVTDPTNSEAIFSYDFIYHEEFNYSNITITYSAKVTAKIGIDQYNKNKVELVYNNYPHIDDSYTTIDKEVELRTAALEVLKVDGKNEALKLEGAEFALYRKYTGDDDIKFDKQVVLEEDWVLIAEGISDGKGIINFERLAYGEYKLVETKPPFGYQKLLDPVTFTIDKDSKGEALLITKTVKNIKGFNLPSTGAAGTYAFTIVGLGIMVSGVFLFFKDKNRKHN